MAIGVSAAPVVDTSGRITVAAGFSRGYLPMISVQTSDVGTPAAAVSAVDTFGRLGVAANGRFIIAERSGNSTLARDCAALINRATERVVLHEAAVSGAARRAAGVLTGAWPLWPAAATTRV